jgi:hypothetical protein
MFPCVCVCVCVCTCVCTCVLVSSIILLDACCLAYRSVSRTRNDHYHSNKATIGSFNDGPRIQDSMLCEVCAPDAQFASGTTIPSCTHRRSVAAPCVAAGQLSRHSSLARTCSHFCLSLPYSIHAVQHTLFHAISVLIEFFMSNALHSCICVHAFVCGVRVQLPRRSS